MKHDALIEKKFKKEVKFLLTTQPPSIKDLDKTFTLTMKEFFNPKKDVKNFIKGSAFNVFFGFLYLIKNFKNLCYPLKIRNIDYLGRNQFFYWKQLAIVYSRYEPLECLDDKDYSDKSKYNLYLPPNFLDDLKSCKKRFIAFPLFILWEKVNGAAHCNAIIIDTHKKTIERFEPYGKYPGVSNIKHSSSVLLENFDKKLNTFMVNNFSSEYKYYKPKNYCPVNSFQTIEEKQVNLGKTLKQFSSLEDETGYCATWSLWYVNLRLKYPDVAREDLIIKALTKLKKYSSKNRMLIRLFIRNYSEFIKTQIKVIYDDVKNTQATIQNTLPKTIRNLNYTFFSKLNNIIEDSLH